MAPPTTRLSTGKSPAKRAFVDDEILSDSEDVEMMDTRDSSEYEYEGEAESESDGSELDEDENDIYGHDEDNESGRFSGDDEDEEEVASSEDEEPNDSKEIPKSMANVSSVMDKLEEELGEAIMSCGLSSLKNDWEEVMNIFSQVPEATGGEPIKEEGIKKEPREGGIRSSGLPPVCNCTDPRCNKTGHMKTN